MTQQKAAERYLEAAALLPPRLREAAERLCQVDQARAEELRLRAGRPMTAAFPEGERPMPGAVEAVTCKDLELVLEIATHASVHTAQAQLSNGFFTVDGGHRIGICGSGVMQDGQVRNLRQISSLAIRVAREVPGVARLILDRLWQDGVLHTGGFTAGGRENNPAPRPDPQRFRWRWMPCAAGGSGGRTGRIGGYVQRGTSADYWQSYRCYERLSEGKGTADAAAGAQSPGTGSR